MKLLIILLLLALNLSGIEPRRILALWDSSVDSIVEITSIHTQFEMPLNYLGYDVIYYDVRNPLPDISQRKDILGIILAFNDETAIQDPIRLITWASRAIDQGKKVVIMQNPGFLTDITGAYVPGDIQNRLFEKMGFINTQKWINLPFKYKITQKSPLLFPFEANYPERLPGFYITRAKEATSYLSVSDSESTADLIIIGKQGAYVSQYYLGAFNWYFNPYRFFELTFGDAIRPIPDITTLCGRRIFYATCHGDGWNNETVHEKYRGTGTLCSEVLLKEVIKQHPDIPIAVGVVAANVDPKWVAREKSRQITREYFEQPQVEASTHTYSHPFNWSFFETGGPEREIEFLHLYPYGTWQSSFLSWFRSKYYQFSQPQKFEQEKWRQVFATPRAYANEPFDLNREIYGSTDYLNQFAPKNNQVKLLIWPGDSLPWQTPVLLCKKAGIKNFGGGFVRLDPDFPSLLYVYPIARKPGGIIQPYASANSEISYTNDWSSQFYGFVSLPITLKNTDAPRRIKPVHLFYHSYSGQFIGSVNAILANIAYIKSLETNRIFVKRFCDIVEGFYSTETEKLGATSWKILSRKGLQTMRFDRAEHLNVDFSKSKGVMGFNVYQESLYVHLDPMEREPIVTLSQEIPKDAYLMDSSWEVWDFDREKMSFQTCGWGKLLMRWKMPEEGEYQIHGVNAKTEKQILNITLDLPFNSVVKLEIKKGASLN